MAIYGSLAFQILAVWTIDILCFSVILKEEQTGGKMLKFEIKQQS